MALKFPNGTVFGFSTVMGTPVNMTALTNGSPASATVTGGNILPADVLLIKTAGWALINQRVAVAGLEDTDGNIPLLGIDTTSLVDFPAARGAGQLIQASGFVDLSQQGDPTMSGGDQQYYTGQHLEDRTNRQFQVPTVRTPRTIAVPLDTDWNLPWYNALVKADRARDPVVLRAKLPDGVTLYYFAYPSFDGTPTMAVNNPMQNTANFSLISEFTRVEAA